MKKLLFILLTISLSNTFAQSIIIRDLQGNDVTNTTYTHVGTKDLQEASFTVQIDDAGSVNKKVALRRYEVNACEGTENYFCWTLCYGAVEAGDLPVWEDGPVTVTSDSLFEGFHAYYDGLSIGANSEYRYVLYDTANVNDSAFVNVVFDLGQPECTQVIDQISESIDNISIFPNPTKNVLNISNIGINDKVEIINILGEKTILDSNNSEGKLTFNTSGLKNGIYFVRIIENDSIKLTKKITVKK